MRTSPFSKSESEKSTSFFIRQSKHYQEKVHGTITDFFPNSSDVPHSIRFYMAFFYGAVFFGCFVALFYTGYANTIDNVFLAPFAGGDNASTNCELVPATYTGDYLASSNGYWEGDQKFAYSNAAFQLSIVSFTASTAYYHNMIVTLFEGLTETGAVAKTQDLGGNLLYWMSLVFVNSTSNAQRFSMIGTPLTVFDRDYTEGVVSSVMGNCNVTSTTSFDPSSGIMSLSFNHADYIAEPKCLNAMTPEIFGYNTRTQPELFTFSFDVRTLITGLSVNLGVMTVDQLEEVVAFRQFFTTEGITMEIRAYYDPKYAGMKVINCVSIDTGSSLCAIPLGLNYAFPLFNHVGSNLSYPELCDCGTLTSDELSDSSNNCNVFRFLSGFVFGNSLDTSYMFKLVGKHANSVATVNRLSHQPMFIASSFATTSQFNEELSSNVSLTNAYDFCKIGNLSCSFVSFASYDENPTNWAVSKYYYQLQTGACQDTFTPNYDNWSNFYYKSYAPLNQNYQRCTNQVFQTIVNQAGVAVGNLEIIAPFVILFIFLVTSIHKRIHQVPLDESYTKGEKDSALDAFSMSLLLARDAHLKTTTFHNKESVVAQIAEELSEHTMLSDQSHKAHRAERLSGHFAVSPRADHALVKLTAINRFSHGSHATVAPSESAFTPHSPDTPFTPGPEGKYYVTYEEEQRVLREQLDIGQQQIADQMNVTDSRAGSRGGSMKVEELESQSPGGRSSRKPGAGW